MSTGLIFKTCQFKDDLYSIYKDEAEGTLMFCNEDNCIYLYDNSHGWYKFSTNTTCVDNYTANTYLTYDTPAKEVSDEEMIII